MPVETPMIVAARHIEKGDWVFDRFTGLDSSQDCIAFEVKRGNKYVTVKNANGQILSRRPFEERVSIERMVPTDEEIAAKEAERAAFRAEALEEDISDWVNVTLDSYAEKSAAALATIAETPGREFSGRSGLITLLNLGAYYHIAANIKHIHEYTEEGTKTPLTWAQAYQEWREQIVRNTMSRYQSYPFQKDVVQLAMDEASENAERAVYHALSHGSWSVR